MKPTHTDPLTSITEGFFNKRTEEVLPPGETKAKDVTPVEEPAQITLKDVITAYNSADLTTQIDFIKLLVKHDLEKIHYALKGTK